MLTFEALLERNEKIGVVGLGYVGLPLAVHLSHHFDVVGYDFKASRIAELASGQDRTLEVSEEEMAAAAVAYTDDPAAPWSLPVDYRCRSHPPSTSIASLT